MTVPMSGAESTAGPGATVRGQFAQLTEQARTLLVHSQPEHDISRSVYTPRRSDERFRQRSSAG